MADELHLHYERAKPPAAGATFNDVSEAHALKHRVVAASEVEHQLDGEVGIRVTTQKDPGLDDDAIHEIETWIEEKLLKQIAKVELEFNGGFRMQARLSRSIQVARVDMTIPEETPRRTVMKVIEADNRRSHLINHNQIFKEAIKHLSDRKFVIVTGRLNESFVDLDGREDLLAALGARVEANGSTLLTSFALLESSGAASCNDVLLPWLNSFLPVDEHLLDRTMDRGTVLTLLCEQISQDEDSILLLLSSVDLLSAKDCEWMVGTALPRLQATGDVTILLSGGSEVSSVASSVPGCVTVSTRELDYTDVCDHLARYSSRKESQNAANARRGYSDYKWTRDYAKLGLAEGTWYGD
jgi:hypothetical protein